MLRQRPWASLGVGFVGVIAFGVVVFLVILVAVLLAIGLALVGLNDLVAAIVFAALAAIVMLAFLFFLSAVFGAPTWVGMASMGFSLESAARRWTALILGLVLVVAAYFDPRRRWLARAHRHLLRARCGDTRFPPSQNDDDNGRTDSRLAFQRLDDGRRPPLKTQSVRSTGLTSTTGVPSIASRSLTSTLFPSTARTVTV